MTIARTLSTAPTEPDDIGAIRVVDGTDLIQRVAADSDACWVDLTFNEDEREPYPWTQFATPTSTVLAFGDPIDPTTTDEPDNDTIVAVQRVHTGTHETHWYLARREDTSVPPDRETLRRQNGTHSVDTMPPDVLADLTDEEDEALISRWQLGSCFAEDAADWGNPYGFVWNKLGTDGNPDVTVTVYSLVKPAVTAPNPYPEAVDPSLGAAFAAVVETARGFSPQRADELQEKYERQWSGWIDRVGGRVHDALTEAGLVESGNTDPAGAWIYLDQLCGIVGGASDVATAVLARDHGLISDKDFDLLTHWWVAAGLDLPHQLTRTENR